jgi:hypothetical protein
MTPPDWPEAVLRLSKVTIFDYFKNRSMPAFVEPLVDELVSSFASSSPVERRKLLTSVSPELSSVLGWYARKLAGRAVRDRSTFDLKNAMAALALVASRADFRDAMAPLALLNNSALLLGEDPRSLFDAASKMSTQPAADLFRAFQSRPSDQKSIGAFGFSEGVGPHGFDYVPLLAEYGGPTPF